MLQEETLACCLLSYLAAYLMVVLARRACRDNTNYEYVNELVCTAMWLSWCFETLLLKSVVDNEVIYRVIQFSVLLAQTYIYQGAYGNSCLLLLGYLRRRLSSEKAMRLLLCQLLAIPISIGTIVALRWSLSSWSPPHGQTFHQTFLAVTIPSGFLCELVGTVFALLPMLVIDDKLTLNVVVSLTFVALDVLLGHTTGAFFNPLPITTFSLFYRLPNWSEVVPVYWCGPAAGGLVFYVLLRQRSKTKLL